jgi:hypothetical protein
MGRIAAITVACALLAAASGAAAQPCDRTAAARERDQIAARLDADARNSRIWNLGWGIGLGAVAAGTAVFALEPQWLPVIDVDRPLRAALVVTSVKAALGAGSRLVLPLRARRAPPATGDACADLAAARAALAWTARRQRGSFWMGILGGVATHIAGGTVLIVGFDAWTLAGIGLVVGTAATAAMAWSQPQGSWHLQVSGSAGAARSAWVLSARTDW